MVGLESTEVARRSRPEPPRTISTIEARRGGHSGVFSHVVTPRLSPSPLDVGLVAHRSEKLAPLAGDGGPVVAVRPEGANHLWRKKPPRELSIDLVADERLGRVTGRAGAS